MAILLSGNSIGLNILAADHYRLARLINEECLNQRIDHGTTLGKSVAFNLANTPLGRTILADNHYRLARLINNKTLNDVLPNQR